MHNIARFSYEILQHLNRESTRTVPGENNIFFCFQLDVTADLPKRASEPLWNKA